MKKLFFALMLFGIAESAKSQTAFTQGVSKPTGAYSNAQADTMRYTLSRSYKQVSIQFLDVKTSGTMAGTATLYRSSNGIDWVSTGTALTLTDVARNFTIWEFTTSVRYFMIIVAGGTSLAATASATMNAN